MSLVAQLNLGKTRFHTRLPTHHNHKKKDVKSFYISQKHNSLTLFIRATPFLLPYELPFFSSFFFFVLDSNEITGVCVIGCFMMVLSQTKPIRNKLEQSYFMLEDQKWECEIFCCKEVKGRGGGAAATVLQATGGLSYLGTTPDREAGISCC